MTHATGPTSLVPYRRTVDETGAPVCPRKPSMRLVSTVTGQVVPGGCQVYSCEVCGPYRAAQVARLATERVTAVLADGGRSRFFTLTLAPDEWAVLRQKMRDLRRLLHRRGMGWEHLWAVECGKRSGMRHVHGLQFGDYVPQRVLGDVWGARVDIRAVRSGAVSGYALKDALRVVGYATKGTANGGLSEHLALNGGRVAHWSRGFFTAPLSDLRKGDGTWQVLSL